MSLSPEEPHPAPISLATALRDQMADSPSRGADLVAAVAAALTADRVALVLPAAVLAAANERPGRRALDGPTWLADQLGRTYAPAPPGGWAALVAADRVDVIVLDATLTADPSAPTTAEMPIAPTTDQPTTTDQPATTDLPAAAGPIAVPIHRVALPPGQTALHPLSRRPAWAAVVGFCLLAAACWALLWSYDYRPLVSVVLAGGLAAAFAGVRGHGPFSPGRRPGVQSWARARQHAVLGGACTAAVSFLIGLLAIDGLSARDSLVVIVPMIAAGWWLGGGDAVAVMWHQTRNSRVVADVGGVRVVSQAGVPTM